MTIDVESKARLFVERVGFFVERFEPVVRRVREIIVSAVKFGVGAGLAFGAAFFLLGISVLLRLPDAELWQEMQGSWGSVTASRSGAGDLRHGGLDCRDDLRPASASRPCSRPHNETAGRIADLEIKLRAAEAELIEAEQFEDEAAEAVQFAEETKWAINAIAAVADVFKIDGVLEAARRACRKALHPDSHPGASARRNRRTDPSASSMRRPSFRTSSRIEGGGNGNCWRHHRDDFSHGCGQGNHSPHCANFGWNPACGNSCVEGGPNSGHSAATKCGLRAPMVPSQKVITGCFVWDFSGTRSGPVTAAVAGFSSAAWPEFGPPYTFVCRSKSLWRW